MMQVPCIGAQAWQERGTLCGCAGTAHDLCGGLGRRFRLLLHQSLGHLHPPPSQGEAGEHRAEHPEKAPHEAVPVPGVARVVAEELPLGPSVIGRDEVLPDPRCSVVLEGAAACASTARSSVAPHAEKRHPPRRAVQELAAVRHQEDGAAMSSHGVPKLSALGTIARYGQSHLGARGILWLVQVDHGRGPPAARAARADLRAGVGKVHVA
mmetsp:Transcript_79563/g.208961  ORF Transcript_79563/g.208961 Transcript_79563/m.208961 type:complete len:210 (+) Transcript_79563:289-918(+)